MTRVFALVLSLAVLAACGGREAAEAEPEDPRAAALARSEAFLAENAGKPGVITTESGLQYRIVESGPADGATPYAGQFVCVHYAGRLIDGAEFDSSYSRGAPAAFASDRLIAGWVEALSLMRPGDKWELFIHPGLGYGERGSAGSIGPNEALIFEIELLDTLAGPVPRGMDCSLLRQKREAAEAFLKANSAQEGVVTTESGLQYRVVEAGPADGASPAPGQGVCVHYRGTLTDGTEFDSSYSRGQPIAFASNGVIQGWVEALALMRPGDVWKLFIHPDLAYGQFGAGADIGPNEALVFDVELLSLLDGPVPADGSCPS